MLSSRKLWKKVRKKTPAAIALITRNTIPTMTKDIITKTAMFFLAVTANAQSAIGKNEVFNSSVSPEFVNNVNKEPLLYYI